MNKVAPQPAASASPHEGLNRAYLPLVGTAFAFFAMTVAGLVGAANVAMTMVM